MTTPQPESTLPWWKSKDFYDLLRTNFFPALVVALLIYQIAETNELATEVAVVKANQQALMTNQQIIRTNQGVFRENQQKILIELEVHKEEHRQTRQQRTETETQETHADNDIDNAETHANLDRQ